MSYLLKTVLDELEGGGMITTDDDLVIETLNNDLGLNIHHDKVFTTKEIEILLDTILKLIDLTPIGQQEEVSQITSEALDLLVEG